ncbi:MAG: hypothetical protein KJ709_07625 [Nanoarchaeota archaeon]|nr:hypothetical protein [Nanoarchaeota archaeon]
MALEVYRNTCKVLKAKGTKFPYEVTAEDVLNRKLSKRATFSEVEEGAFHLEDCYKDGSTMNPG